MRSVPIQTPLQRTWDPGHASSLRHSKEHCFVNFNFERYITAQCYWNYMFQKQFYQHIQSYNYLVQELLLELQWSSLLQQKFNIEHKSEYVIIYHVQYVVWIYLISGVEGKLQFTWGPCARSFRGRDNLMAFVYPPFTTITPYVMNTATFVVIWTCIFCSLKRCISSNVIAWAIFSRKISIVIWNNTLNAIVRVWKECVFSSRLNKSSY